MSLASPIILVTHAGPSHLLLLLLTQSSSLHNSQLKSQYREQHASLLEVQTELQYCRQYVDQCRTRLLAEFDVWYKLSFLGDGGEEEGGREEEKVRGREEEGEVRGREGGRRRKQIPSVTATSALCTVGIQCTTR